MNGNENVGMPLLGSGVLKLGFALGKVPLRSIPLLPRLGPWPSVPIGPFVCRFLCISILKAELNRIE